MSHYPTILASWTRHTLRLHLRSLDEKRTSVAPLAPVVTHLRHLGRTVPDDLVNRTVRVVEQGDLQPGEAADPFLAAVMVECGRR